MWQIVATEMKMPWEAVESIAWQMGQHELSVRAKALPGPILICSCGRCDGILPFAQGNSLCYTCNHELKLHSVTAAELQPEPYTTTSNLLTEHHAVAQQGVPLEFRQPSSAP